MRKASPILSRMHFSLLFFLCNILFVSVAGASESITWTEVQDHVQDASDPKVCSPKMNYLEKDFKKIWKNYYGDGTGSLATAAIGPASKMITSCEPAVSGPISSLSSSLLDLVYTPVTVTASDVACVAVAQKQFGLSGWGFTECRNGKAVPHATIRGKLGNLNTYEPCRSLTNAKVVAQSFKNVAACLGGDPRELFKIFSKESGMILNSTSYTGARGIGQMTSIALLQVQNVDDGLPYGSSPAALKLAKTIRENILGTLTKPPKPSCDPLHEFEGRRMTKATAADACTLLKFPDAAFYPTVLSMKHYLYYRANIESWAEEHGAVKLFGKDYKEILNKVTAYSYSASGYGNTFPTFQAMVLAAKKKGGFQKAAFLAVLRNRLMARSPRAASEIKTYVTGNGKGLEDRYAAIKKELGGAECF